MIERYLRAIVVGVIVLCAGVSVKAEGVYEAWVARYNGTASDYDEGFDIAVDDSGNVFVTGTTWTNTSAANDYITIKYSPNGDTLWSRQYNGILNGDDKPHAITVDDNGSVYVTGTSGGQYGTIRYNSNGDYVWIRRYPATPSGAEAWALAVDNAGNVYVTGEATGNGTGMDYVTVKYSSSGDTVWVKRYNHSPLDYNSYDAAYSMVVDDSGQVFITGTSYGYGTGTYNDYVTIKYTQDGDTSWVRRYNADGSGTDVAKAITVDDSGNVYVTGLSYGSANYADYATIKYSAVGDTIWVRRYNGPGDGHDEARAIAVDKSGHVYVTGKSQGSGSNSDYCTIKYASNGDPLWVRRYDGPANWIDEASDLAVDDSGNVYVAGYRYVVGIEYATIKYSPNGDLMWVRSYAGPVGGSLARALTIDKNFNVYVTGSSNASITTGSPDIATIKYSPCAIPGDANTSMTLTLSDIISTVNYIFNKPGCTPTPVCWLSGLLCRGDWDGSTTVTLSDVIRGVNYIFNKPGGPWNPVPYGACCD